MATMPTTQIISKRITAEIERGDDEETIAATPVLVIIISEDELDIIKGIR